MLGPGALSASSPLVDFLIFTAGPTGWQFASNTWRWVPGTCSPTLASPWARCAASALTLMSERFVVSKAGYEERVVEMMIEGDTRFDAVLLREAS